MTSPARPGGVTYACVLSIVLGALGALAGVVLFAFATLFSLIPFVGVIFGAFGGLAGALVLGMGVLGIVAGAQGLQGAPWSRWTMIALFGVGAIFSFTTLVVPALNVVAIVMLSLQPATTFFEGSTIRTTTPQ